MGTYASSFWAWQVCGGYLGKPCEGIVGRQMGPDCALGLELWNTCVPGKVSA